MSSKQEELNKVLKQIPSNQCKLNSGIILLLL
ncbi:hypothetical protein ACOMICROBIO_EPCKBFOG_00356 [Vibrio sp. B1FLJ16]|nr:hypothetical protein ACOMICROBIO_EPCKBFOG_00356 [Vibrio sp. B1FLJ16]CAE6883923.1 hypothetical protein ACOMICROBIO_EPCKBFOG_00356 [Vibrio sp. B1FLJ16]